MALTLGRSYRLLWTASTASSLGSGMTGAALPVLTTTLTTQPLLVSGVSAVRELPWLLLGLLAGAITDRIDQRRLAVTALAANTVIIAVLAVVIATDHVSLPLIYLVSCAYATCGIFVGTSMTTLTPQLVPAPELGWANSRLSSAGGAASNLIGPPAGSTLFSLAATLPFGLEAILSAVSSLLIQCLPKQRGRQTQQRSTPVTSIWRDAADGARWLAKHRPLRTLIILTALLAITDSAWFAILVLYVRAVLHQPARTYGILVGTAAVGGVIGSLIASRLAHRYGPSRCLASTLVAAAAGQLLLAVTAAPAIAAIALAASSFNFGLWDVITATLWQTHTPHELLGRVTSTERTITMTASPLGALIGGLTATAWGVRMPFLLGVPVLLAGAAFARRGLGNLRLAVPTTRDAHTDPPE